MHRKNIEPLLALSLLLTLAACGRTQASPSPAAPAAAAAPASAPAATRALPKPEELVTPAEAAALLGGDVTLEVHNLQAAYPGSSDFAYQTKNVRILSAAIYPEGGAEMFDNMKKTLSAPGRHPLLPCSVGDSCFMTGKGMVHVRKGGTYFTLADDNAEVGKLEELARTVAGRLPA
jgi:predicted small lipoprotein YifL